MQHLSTEGCSQPLILGPPKRKSGSGQRQEYMPRCSSVPCSFLVLGDRARLLTSWWLRVLWVTFISVEVGLDP